MTIESKMQLVPVRATRTSRCMRPLSDLMNTAYSGGWVIEEIVQKSKAKKAGKMLAPQIEYRSDNYSLNVKKNLKKKLEAANRSVLYEATANSDGVHYKVQTGLYELLRVAVHIYFTHFKQYEQEAHTEVFQDKEGNTTKVIYKIRKVSAQNTAQYTLTMFHTTSTLYVNGKQHKLFAERDFDNIVELIREAENIHPTLLNDTICKQVEYVQQQISQGNYNSNAGCSDSASQLLELEDVTDQTKLDEVQEHGATAGQNVSKPGPERVGISHGAKKTAACSEGGSFYVEKAMATNKVRKDSDTVMPHEGDKQVLIQCSEIVSSAIKSGEAWLNNHQQTAWIQASQANAPETALTNPPTTGIPREGGQLALSATATNREPDIGERARMTPAMPVVHNNKGKGNITATMGLVDNCVISATLTHEAAGLNEPDATSATVAPSTLANSQTKVHSFGLDKPMAETNTLGHKPAKVKKPKGRGAGKKQVSAESSKKGRCAPGGLLVSTMLDGLINSPKPTHEGPVIQQQSPKQGKGMTGNQSHDPAERHTDTITLQASYSAPSGSQVDHRVPLQEDTVEHGTAQAELNDTQQDQRWAEIATKEGELKARERRLNTQEKAMNIRGKDLEKRTLQAETAKACITGLEAKIESLSTDNKSLSDQLSVAQTRLLNNEAQQVPHKSNESSTGNTEHHEGRKNDRHVPCNLHGESLQCRIAHEHQRNNMDCNCHLTAHRWCYIPQNDTCCCKSERRENTSDVGKLERHLQDIWSKLNRLEANSVSSSRTEQMQGTTHSSHTPPGGRMSPEILAIGLKLDLIEQKLQAQARLTELRMTTVLEKITIVLNKLCAKSGNKRNKTPPDEDTFLARILQPHLRTISMNSGTMKTTAQIPRPHYHKEVPSTQTDVTVKTCKVLNTSPTTSGTPSHYHKESVRKHGNNGEHLKYGNHPTARQKDGELDGEQSTWDLQSSEKGVQERQSDDKIFTGNVSGNMKAGNNMKTGNVQSSSRIQSLSDSEAVNRHPGQILDELCGIAEPPPGPTDIREEEHKLHCFNSHHKCAATWSTEQHEEHIAEQARLADVLQERTSADTASVSQDGQSRDEVDGKPINLVDSQNRYTTTGANAEMTQESEKPTIRTTDLDVSGTNRDSQNKLK